MAFGSGFDATQRATMTVAVPGTNGAADAQGLSSEMHRLLYLPVYGQLPARSAARLVEVLSE